MGRNPFIYNIILSNYVYVHGQEPIQHFSIHGNFNIIIH